MTTSIETSGATVDEAIERALEELEEARENVEVEVLEDAPQARVRVTLRETYAGNARLAVMELLSKMGIVAQVYVRNVEDPVTIDIAGQDLGVLIGWRGETPRSFQAVVHPIINAGPTDRRRGDAGAGRHPPPGGGAGRGKGPPPRPRARRHGAARPR